MENMNAYNPAKVKECFGIKFPKGTEVVVCCRDEDREAVKQTVERMGYKIAHIQLADKSILPICPKGGYLLMKKPEPFRWADIIPRYNLCRAWIENMVR